MRELWRTDHLLGQLQCAHTVEPRNGMRELWRTNYLLGQLQRAHAVEPWSGVRELWRTDHLLGQLQHAVELWQRMRKLRRYHSMRRHMQRRYPGQLGTGVQCRDRPWGLFEWWNDHLRCNVSAGHFGIWGCDGLALQRCPKWELGLGL